MNEREAEQAGKRNGNTLEGATQRDRFGIEADKRRSARSGRPEYDDE
jgi:hypothetical protein